jgi:hypothetical protein
MGIERSPNVIAPFQIDDAMGIPPIEPPGWLKGPRFKAYKDRYAARRRFARVRAALRADWRRDVAPRRRATVFASRERLACEAAE